MGKCFAKSLAKKGFCWPKGAEKCLEFGFIKICFGRRKREWFSGDTQQRYEPIYKSSAGGIGCALHGSSGRFQKSVSRLPSQCLVFTAEGGSPRAREPKDNRADDVYAVVMMMAVYLVLKIGYSVTSGLMKIITMRPHIISRSMNNWKLYPSKKSRRYASGYPSQSVFNNAVFFNTTLTSSPTCVGECVESDHGTDFWQIGGPSSIGIWGPMMPWVGTSDPLRRCPVGAAAAPSSAASTTTTATGHATTREQGGNQPNATLKPYIVWESLHSPLGPYGVNSPVMKPGISASVVSPFGNGNKKGLLSGIGYSCLDAESFWKPLDCPLGQGGERVVGAVHERAMIVPLAATGASPASTASPSPSSTPTSTSAAPSTTTTTPTSTMPPLGAPPGWFGRPPAISHLQLVTTSATGAHWTPPSPYWFHLEAVELPIYPGIRQDSPMSLSCHVHGLAMNGDLCASMPPTADVPRAIPSHMETVALQAPTLRAPRAMVDGLLPRRHQNPGWVSLLHSQGSVGPFENVGLDVLSASLRLVEYSRIVTSVE